MLRSSCSVIVKELAKQTGSPKVSLSSLVSKSAFVKLCFKGNCALPDIT